MSVTENIKKELYLYSTPEKAQNSQRFFKTGKGQYGEGDVFIGVIVPDQRKVARKYYKEVSIADITDLLNEPVHEYRLTALLMMVYKFEKSKNPEDKKAIVESYLANLKNINNWDLVDSSAPQILGAFLYDKDRNLLYQLADSDNLWEQRVGIMATFYFIKQKNFQDTLNISEKLLNHKHDLIHKAVGWMLREIGNRDLKAELVFLDKYCKIMPRTMLRYAIEKFEPELRMKYLKA